MNQNYRGQNYRGGDRRNYRSDNYERERSRSKESFQIMLEGMIEIVVVGLDQFQKPIQIGIGLDAIGVRNMTILQKTVLL